MAIFFIPGNVPSSKNSRIFNLAQKRSIKSEACQKYEKESKVFYQKFAIDFRSACKAKTKPFIISFQFIRKGKHKFDYINPAQTVQDLMVKHAWIEDDNASIMVPVFIPFEVDRNNPGVYIQV